jgi:hypothetical protein
VCITCTFRPWASRGQVVSAFVEVVRHGHVIRRVAAHRASGSSRWTARIALRRDEHVIVPAGAVRDSYGETNGHPQRELQR